MPAKQYEVVRYFRITDRRTGQDSHYHVGDVYSGPLNNPYVLDPNGPDGRGALIVEKAASGVEKSDSAAVKPVSLPSSDSTDKEK